MKNAGAADGFARLFGQKIALARHHRDGDGAVVAADRLKHPLGQHVARAIYGGEEAQAPRRRSGRRLDFFRRAQHIADAADAREKGVAGEIVAARQRSFWGRQRPDFGGDEIARSEAGRAACAQAQAERGRAGAHPFHFGDAQHDSRAIARGETGVFRRPLRSSVHFLDEAGDLADKRSLQDRRVHPRHAPACRKLAGEKGGQRDQGQQQGAVGASERRKKTESGGERRDKPKARLGRRENMGDRPRAGADRQPEEKAPLAPFLLEGRDDPRPKTCGECWRGKRWRAAGRRARGKVSRYARHQPLFLRVCAMLGGARAERHQPAARN